MRWAWLAAAAACQPVRSIAVDADGAVDVALDRWYARRDRGDGWSAEPSPGGYGTRVVDGEGVLHFASQGGYAHRRHARHLSCP